MNVYLLILSWKYEGDEVVSVHKSYDSAEKRKQETVVKGDQYLSIQEVELEE